MGMKWLRTMRVQTRLSVVSEPEDVNNDLLWLGRKGFKWIVVHSRGERPKWDAWMCGSSQGSAADQNARAQFLYDYLVETIGEPVALVGGDMLFTIPEL
jgi:hypothetical protein